jgi:hypothetical protein
LDNDKLFAAYSLTLFVGVIVMLTAAVTVLGTGTWPTPLHLAEHVALGLCVRTGYKWIGGFDAADWSLTSEPAAATVTSIQLPAPEELQEAA